MRIFISIELMIHSGCKVTQSLNFVIHNSIKSQLHMFLLMRHLYNQPHKKWTTKVRAPRDGGYVRCVPKWKIMFSKAVSGCANIIIPRRYWEGGGGNALFAEGGKTIVMIHWCGVSEKSKVGEGALWKIMIIYIGWGSKTSVYLRKRGFGLWSVLPCFFFGAFGMPIEVILHH